MPLSAQTIVTRVGRALKDPMHDQWTIEELLEHISDAQRATVLLSPESNPVYATVDLVAGIRQDLPDNGYQLLTVTRNINADDSSGRAVTPTTRASLDDAQRDWPMADEDDVVRNFLYDVRTRRNFYVYPPNDAAGRLEIYYSRMPVELTRPSDPNAALPNLELDDIYLPVLHAYVMHCAHLKDVAEEGQDVARANAYFEKFMTLLLGRADENDIDITLRNEITQQNRMAAATGRRSRARA